MAINFYQYILYLDQIGVADIIWPFLLVFTLAFAMLEKSGVFRWYHPGSGANSVQSESNSRRLSTFVALALAGTVVFPHITNPGSKYDVVPIIKEAMPKTLLWVLGAVMVVLLISTFVKDKLDFKSWGLMLFIIIGAFLAVTGVFTKAALGYIIPPSILNSGIVNVIVGVLVVVIIFNAITGAVDPTRKSLPEKLEEWRNWIGPH